MAPLSWLLVMSFTTSVDCLSLLLSLWRYPAKTAGTSAIRATTLVMEIIFFIKGVFKMSFGFVDKAKIYRLDGIMQNIVPAES